MTQAIESQCGIKLANGILSSPTSNVVMAMEAKDDEFNRVGEVNNNGRQVQNKVKCHQCKILTQYKKIVERYQYFTNEIQDIIQASNVKDEVISTIREEILVKLVGLNLAVGQMMSTDGVKIFELNDKCVSMVSGDKTSEPDDKCVSMVSDKLLNKLGANMYNLNSSALHAELPIIKSEKSCTMNFSESKNRDLDGAGITQTMCHDNEIYDNKENLNDTSISILLDDASEASKDANIPLRRSARRKSLAPLSLNTNTSSSYGDQENANDTSTSILFEDTFDASKEAVPRKLARRKSLASHSSKNMLSKVTNRLPKRRRSVSIKNEPVAPVLDNSQALLDSNSPLPTSIEVKCSTTNDYESESVLSTPCSDTNDNSVENNSPPCNSKNKNSVKSNSRSVMEISSRVTVDVSKKCSKEENSSKIVGRQKGLRRSQRRRTLSAKGRLSLLQQKIYDHPPTKNVTAPSPMFLTDSNILDETTQHTPSKMKTDSIKPRHDTLVGSNDCTGVLSTNNEDSTDSCLCPSILEANSSNIISKGRNVAMTIDSEARIEAIEQVVSSKTSSLTDAFPQDAQLPARRSSRKKFRPKREATLPLLAEDEVPSVLKPFDNSTKTANLNISKVGPASSQIDATLSVSESNLQKSITSILPSSPTRSLSSLAISKHKRSRRCSLRLHGGMVTLNEFTDLEIESAARKRKCPKTMKGDQNVIVKVGNKKSRIVSTDNFQINFGTEDASASNIDTNNSSQHVAQNDAKPFCSKNYAACVNIEKGDDNSMQPDDISVSTNFTNYMKDDQNDEYINDDSFNVSAEDIKASISRVFDDGVVEKPCMSARLFACLCIIIERQMSAKCVGDTSNDVLTNPLQPILPFLQALVNAELAAFGDKRTNEGTNKKRLHFCSFDYSTILTPVDIVDGSNQMTEDCIVALYNAVQEMKALRIKLSSEEKINNLTSLVSHLHVFESGGVQIGEECSKTMPFPWPISRFSDASRHYRGIIRAAISRTQTTNDHSSLNKNLGDLIGTAIRFYLRRFFNPIPYSPSNSEIVGAKIRSRVHLIVTMKEESSNVCTAAADGSISSVFSLALRSIDEFFELNASKTVMDQEKYYSYFCQRDASKKGLAFGKLGHDDMKEILLDIAEAQIVLSGIRACTFIRNLLSWPGVSEAISDIGGWSKVEYFAKMYVECKLCAASPDEKHLMLLTNIEQLMQRLHNDYKILRSIEKKCDDSLRKLWKSFRCGTREPSVLLEYPFIKDIRAHFKVGKHTFFPSLVAAPILK